MNIDLRATSLGVELPLDGERHPVESGVAIAMGPPAQWLPAAEWQVSDEATAKWAVLERAEPYTRIMVDATKVRVEVLEVVGDGYMLGDWPGHPAGAVHRRIVSRGGDHP